MVLLITVMEMFVLCQLLFIFYFIEMLHLLQVSWDPWKCISVKPGFHDTCGLFIPSVSVLSVPLFLSVCFTHLSDSVAQEKVVPRHRNVKSLLKGSAVAIPDVFVNLIMSIFIFLSLPVRHNKKPRLVFEWRFISSFKMGGEKVHRTNDYFEQLFPIPLCQVRLSCVYESLLCGKWSFID